MFFENSVCLNCGSALGYVPDAQRLVTVHQDGDDWVATDDADPLASAGARFRWCGNLHLARCNWLVPVTEAETLCASCRLTSVRPNDDEPEALDAFADAETAKRRLLHQLAGLGLPIIDRTVDADRGVTFEFLSSRGRSVTTGHEGGVITLDLSESDDAHREFVRQQLGEQYRTVLGHLRHEIGHYYWPLIVVEAGRLDEFRDVFGDERASYQEALEQHYAGGAGEVDWSATHVSMYATMHPWEDWAETFAHYLHISAGLETADSWGLAVGEPSASAGTQAWTAPGPVEIGPMIDRWLGLTIALNSMSRSIGEGDLYPFVLNPAVVAKLDVVHRAITASAAG